jgi:ribosomal protein S18 acetylase RimI-like enzyme
VDVADDVAVGVIAAFAQGEGWHVVSMWVSAACRRGGRASGLLQELIRYAQAAGARSLDLYVVDNNETARRLYERHGFMRNGVQRPYPNAPGLTESEMRLSL